MDAYAIAIGSNRRHGRHGAPAAIVKASIAAMEEAGLVVTARSHIISTSAVGPAGRAFANAAIVVETALRPADLLRLLKRIEAEFGRRSGRRWGPRVLDLDISLWSGGAWESSRPRLTVPHPALSQRLFVLTPLLPIAGDWRIGRGYRRVRHAHHRLRRRCTG